MLFARGHNQMRAFVFIVYAATDAHCTTSVTATSALAVQHDDDILNFSPSLEQTPLPHHAGHAHTQQHGVQLSPHRLTPSPNFPSGDFQVGSSAQIVQLRFWQQQPQQQYMQPQQCMQQQTQQQYMQQQQYMHQMQQRQQAQTQLSWEPPLTQPLEQFPVVTNGAAALLEGWPLLRVRCLALYLVLCPLKRIRLCRWSSKLVLSARLGIG